MISLSVGFGGSLAVHPQVHQMLYPSCRLMRFGPTGANQAAEPSSQRGKPAKSRRNRRFKAVFSLTRAGEAFALITLMPLITIKTTIAGKEESLSEYLCDWPDCPNPAKQVVGVIRELRAVAMVCEVHSEFIRTQRRNDAA